MELLILLQMTYHLSDYFSRVPQDISLTMGVLNSLFCPFLAPAAAPERSFFRFLSFPLHPFRFGEFQLALSLVFTY